MRVERARPVAAPVVGPPALGPPVRRHGVPVLAVALRYVAEVGLYARFPVHVQLSDQVLLRHGPLLPKDLFVIDRSVGPGVGGNGENTLAQMAESRWHDRLLSVGQNGCFYSSANTNLCVATSELTVEGDLPSSLVICLREAPRSSILWTVPLSCLVSLP